MSEGQFDTMAFLMLTPTLVAVMGSPYILPTGSLHSENTHHWGK